jgi:antirestriction protein
MTMSEEIRFYVADLAAYNAGILHGVWIDACLDIDDIWKEVKAMLTKSPAPMAEEYAIHDHEGFGAYGLSEHEGLERANAIACFIEEHGKIAGDLLNYSGGDLEEATRMMEENYRGLWDSLEDYARDLTEQTTEIPQHLEFYIDYEKMGRDMELSGDILTIETRLDEVHVFWAH